MCYIAAAKCTTQSQTEKEQIKELKETNELNNPIHSLVIHKDSTKDTGS